MRLSQRFFLVALIVVLGVVIAFGGWAGAYVSGTIVKGVGATAAGSIEALISRRLDGALTEGSLTDDDRRVIEAAFDIASSTDSTRLLMLRLRRLDGELVLQTGNDFEDAMSMPDHMAAAQGQLDVRLIDVTVPALGGLPASRLPVLKIYTPLRDDDESVIGVAELYFGARAVTELQAQARTDAWIIAALVGFAALGTVAMLVDVTSDIIAQQRQRLAANLQRTRGLLRQNIALHQVSDSLRMESILANERVLAEVGSDIHDGPVQLLTLLILRLPGKAEGANADRGLAQQALEELRNISAGLVLPQLATMDLEQSIEAAISRHQNLTGVEIEASIDIPARTTAPLTARICAYRVVQEALTNAYRHNDGGGAHVGARVTAGWLELTITNAIAPGVSLQPSVDRLGLRGMFFRVESQGGRLDVAMERGEARVRAQIPLAELPHVSSPDEPRSGS